MISEYRNWFVVLLLVICLGVTFVHAGIDGVVFIGEPGVQVNGHSFSRGVLKPGDEIQSTTNRTTKIISTGMIIALKSQAKVSYGSDVININSGLVSIECQRPVKATYNNVSVVPTGPGSHFLIGRSSDKSVIAAVKNPLQITVGTKLYLLPQGKALVQDRVPEPATIGTSKEGGTKPSDNKRGGSMKTGKSLPGWVEVAIIGGATGSVLGGLALAGSFNEKKSISATQP